MLRYTALQISSFVNMDRVGLLSTFLVIFIVFKVHYSVCYLLYHDQKLYEGSVCVLATGGKGICTLKNNCTNYLENHREINVCGFKKSTEIICCPEINYTGPYPTIVQSCADRLRRILDLENADIETKKRTQEEKQKLSDHHNSVINVFDMKDEEIRARCKTETALIAQTEEERNVFYNKCIPFYESRPLVSPAVYFPTIIYQHPHMAALGWKGQDGKISWSCGGSLIQRNFVITAAHCIQNLRKPPDIIRVGDIDLRKDWDDKISVDYEVEKVFVHENYNSPVYYNDIALVKVKKFPEFRYKIRPLPACVWMEDRLPSENLLMMGYGATGFGKAFIERLYEGNLTVLDNQDCSKLYTSVEALPDGVIESQLCAHDPEEILDTCEGDSGGHLQFNANDTYRTPYITGITSFGILCLDGNPGVYTRISSYLEWIEKTIADNL